MNMEGNLERDTSWLKKQRNQQKIKIFEKNCDEISFDEHSDWSKYIFVANEYTANVIYCSPQLCIFIEPINTHFLHVFTNKILVAIAFGDWATVHFRHCYGKYV
jgi:hypothetical protein